MSNAEQIALCQTPQLSYIAGQVDAEKRLKRGKRQSYCSACERWQWSDRRCSLYRNDPALQRELEKGFR